MWSTKSSLCSLLIYIQWTAMCWKIKAYNFTHGGLLSPFVGSLGAIIQVTFLDCLVSFLLFMVPNIYLHKPFTQTFTSQQPRGSPSHHKLAFKILASLLTGQTELGPLSTTRKHAALSFCIQYLKGFQEHPKELISRGNILRRLLHIWFLHWNDSKKSVFIKILKNVLSMLWTLSRSCVWTNMEKMSKYSSRPIPPSMVPFLSQACFQNSGFPSHGTNSIRPSFYKETHSFFVLPTGDL